MRRNILHTKIMNPCQFLSIFTCIGILVFSQTAYAMVAGGCGTACVNLGDRISSQAAYTIDDLKFFLLRQLILIFIFYFSGYILGRIVETKKISASLSRKTLCLLTFSASYINSLYTPALNTAFTILYIVFGCAVILIMLSTLSIALRSKVSFLKTVFTAINRPEDEPHTLLWLSTEAIVTSLIVILFIPIMNHFSAGIISNDNALFKLMLIPIFASGIGDALAEIVGKKWGRHHYVTYSIFSKRFYTRTHEGSFMVFLTTIVVGVVIAISSAFTMPAFYWKALLLLPFTLTIAEAKSPHTWDNPIMYLTGYITILFCLI